MWEVSTKGKFTTKNHLLFWLELRRCHFKILTEQILDKRGIFHEFLPEEFFRNSDQKVGQKHYFLISDNFQLTFIAMAEESNLHQAGSFQPYFPILCTLQFICSVLLPDTKSCYSTSFGECTNGPNNLRWYTVLNFDGNFVLFLGSVQLRAASKIRNCFCYLLTFNFM